MINRPNLHFSLIVFGTALIYTVLTWVAGASAASGLDLSRLAAALLVNIAVVGAMELRRSNIR